MGVVLVVLVMTGGKQSQLLVRLGLSCWAWTGVWQKNGFSTMVDIFLMPFWFFPQITHQPWIDNLTQAWLMNVYYIRIASEILKGSFNRTPLFKTTSSQHQDNFRDNLKDHFKSRQLSSTQLGTTLLKSCFQYNVYQPRLVYSISVSEVILLKIF